MTRLVDDAQNLNDFLKLIGAQSVEERTTVDVAKKASNDSAMHNNIPAASSADYHHKAATAAVAASEDREHATHFTSWGTPDARNRPKSMQRKIILTCLPPNSDLTLVQSLIHGSSIESMTMSPTRTTAYVLLTSGNAAKTYYDHYPNGMQFKHRGKMHTVWVDLGEEVDIVSSIMEGYLACGASRVVRAIGADEDWGMRALHKLAEGQSKTARKLESIVDTLRNEVRTIVFRFTNIADAVQFKASLSRDYDWEACDVDFMEDLCEKATGCWLN